MKKNKLYNRTSHAESLNDIISNVLKVQNLETPLYEKRAEEAWAEVAGAPFMKYTTTVKAHKGILYVSLSSSVVRNELVMAKKFIIKRLNLHLGHEVITDIIFR